MRFICDDNLGKLAKYLRILGFDTSFKEPISNPEIIRLAAAEQRFLLTRDHRLSVYSHPYGLLILEDDDPLKQLSTVVNSLHLAIDPAKLFQRCSRCNALIEPVDKAGIKNRLFPFILKTQKEISRCPSCGRFYWKGTHYSRLLRKLRRAIPDTAVTGDWPGD
jgi:uncharacterized protein with PIN domain